MSQQPLSILHVVPRLNRGGGGASVLHEWAATREAVTPAFLSLERDVDVSMLREAMRRRIRVHVAPPAEEEAYLLQGADVVVVHFWQCPSLFHFCKRLQGRKLRLILYSRVRGTTPPQILHPALLALADGWISTAPAELPFHGPQLWMPALIDPALATAGPPARPASPFVVAHCNTLNASKMHPDFAALHEGHEVEVFGVGGDEAALAAFPHLRLQGFVAKWWSATRAQVLGHPLHPATSSSSDKVVQEAMFAGLPVVLLAPTGLGALVGDAAQVAPDAGAYRGALDRLAGDLVWRKRWADAGLSHAHAHLHPHKNALRLFDFYTAIRSSPATEKAFPVTVPDYLATVHPVAAPGIAAWHLDHAEGGRHHWAKWT